MRSKWIAMVVVAVCAVLFLASVATAQFLLCVSEPKLKGGKTVAACNKEGDRFAFIGKDGIARIMTQEEMNLTFAFNPKIGKMKAFGMEYGGQAEKIPPLPPSAEE
jgi:hypothetical protein